MIPEPGGQCLGFFQGCLDKNNEPILKFSSKKLEEIAKLKKEGYLPKNAVVTFLVYWYDQENEKESLIVLPEVFFRYGFS
jgi:ATP-dependent DNA helicase RecQ